MSDNQTKKLCDLVSELNVLSSIVKDMPADVQVDAGYADGIQTLIEQITAEAWVVGSAKKLASPEVMSLATRLVQAIVADEKHPDGCDVTAGLFGTELTKLVVELADQEARAYAAEDQVKVAYETAAMVTDAADEQYSPSTIYHVGTDENGKVIGRGIRSTSDAHKDMHVMHAALELSQAYELRGVEFKEHQIGGLMVRPAVPTPKSNVVQANQPAAPAVDDDTVCITATAVRKLLVALTGPDYLVRELQATRGLPVAPGDPGNAIDIVLSEFNAWAAPIEEGGAA